MQDYLLIGEITKPQGVHGELKLRPFTCDPDRFNDLTQAFVLENDAYRPVQIAVRSVGADSVFLRMEGVETRDDAEKMRGTKLYIDRAHAVELDEDSTFICDLIGLRGVLTGGGEIGKITDVLQPSANDVYVFNGPRGEVLVPALKSVVVRVHLAAGTILLDSARMAEVAVYSDED